MAQQCVFCGQRPESKTREHVIPKWLIQATGDPKRSASFGTYNLKNKAPKTFSFDQLTFPACASCNGAFSQLEGQAKLVVERLLTRQPLSSKDFHVLLDWLDKVRTGMWLGLMYLDDNPWEITPTFHISKRIGLHDRTVGIAFIEGRHDGVNLLGPESPCFGLSPTTMCLFVNDVGLFNSSAVGLCSRRLGFPFVTNCGLRDDGLLECQIASGLERILRPVEPVVDVQSTPFLYQPIFEREPEGSLADAFETTYVRLNSFDFDAGIGALFLQHKGVVSKYDDQSADAWMPLTPISVREAYRFGRRWAYKQLEWHYSGQTTPGDRLKRAFPKLHKRLLLGYEDRLGL